MISGHLKRDFYSLQTKYLQLWAQPLLRLSSNCWLGGMTPVPSVTGPDTKPQVALNRRQHLT